MRHTNGRRKRLALLVPRAAESIAGGAEAFCITAAQKLLRSNDVDVLTTCAQDYRTWANVYDEGPGVVDDVPVFRFAVDTPRDVPRFDHLSAQLRYRLATLTDEEQEQWLREQGPYSTTMLRYLWERRERYDAFIFFSYLYAPAYFGIPLVQERSALVPLAHDEWPIYMPVWQRFFEKPRAFVYVSSEERDFVRRHFPRIAYRGPVCEVPVHTQEKADDERFRAEYAISDPFLLYVGRIDDSKGCKELCAFFDSYLRAHPQSNLHLVFAGPGGERLWKSDRIHPIGYVAGDMKWSALAAASAFVMPSPNESLCIALLEAWAAGKPALVNGESPVLVGQCRRSNGGLWYNDQATFDAALNLLLSPAGKVLGTQGRLFFDAHYRDGNVEVVFSQVLQTISERTNRVMASSA